MYEFQYSDKKISWWMPDGFSRREGRRAQDEFTRVLFPWRTLANVVGTFSLVVAACLLIYVALTNSLGSPAQSIGDAFLLVALLWSFAYGPTWMWTSNKVSITLSGAGGISWRNIKWWRIIPADENGNLRAVELGYRLFRKNFTKRLGFDPSEVDEHIVVSFLRRMAPEKERQEV